MSSKVKRTPKPKVDLPEKVPDLIALGFKVAKAGTDNASLFVSPNPKPSDILAATQALETAHTATGPRTAGTVPARGPKETTLRNLIDRWAIYLVSIAETMPGQEAYVFEMGGLGSRKTPQRNNDPLKLSQPAGYPSGKVHAVCKAAKRGTRVYYGWRISFDGGKTWVMSQTNDHFTDFSNIPPGTTIEVQYNTTIKNVTSTWSGSATLVVK